MILLMGGTSETVPIANAISALAIRVFISTVTNDLVFSNLSSAVERRFGELSEEKLEELLINNKFKLVVDASHPYAEIIQRNLFFHCNKLNIPLDELEQGDYTISISYGSITLAGEFTLK